MSPTPITAEPANYFDQGDGTYVVFSPAAGGGVTTSTYQNAVPAAVTSQFSSAAANSAAAKTICSVYVSNLKIDDSDYDFEWTTEQTCSGDYGSQFIDGEMKRSSGSDWDNYGDYAKYPSKGTTAAFVGVNWSLGCDHGEASHNYIGVGIGFSSFGSSGDVRSENQLNSLPCGTEPR